MDKTTVQDALTHLSALGFVEGDTVYFNCLRPQMKFDFIFPDISIASITKAESLGRNIFFCPQRKGDYLSENIKECQVLFYEHDTVNKDLSAKMWKAIGLPPPTIQIDTGNKSIHTYYVLSEPISAELFTEAQKHFIRHFASDAALSNPNRLMRLAGCIHPKTEDKTVSTIYSHNGATYSIDELLPKLRQGEVKKPRKNAKSSLAKVDVDKLTEVREALNAINSPKYLDDEPGWASVGMALRATSESLYQDFVNWSLRSSNSEVCDFAYRWSNWKPEGYTGGKTYKTIFEYAYECGWKPRNPKYQPSPDGKFDHLDNESPQQRSVFGAMVDKIYAGVGNRLAYNSFTCRLMLDGDELTSDKVSIQIQDTLNIDIPRRLFDSKEVIKAVAQRNEFHPIIDYLKSCKPKDGVSHLNVATKYLGATEAVEDEYFAAFLKAAVLRQINTKTPTEYHFILVLLGSTGCGKTSTFKLLFKTWYYVMSTLGGNEWKEGVAKTWLCFWDEMSPVLENKKHADINGFITQSQDFYHELYETKAKLRIRPFVIGGTTTETEFLSENPSLRRFNVVKMESLDRANFERDVDAIWASAYANALANPVLQDVSTFAAIESRNKEFIRPSDYNSIIQKLVSQQYKAVGYVRPDEVVEAAITAKIPIPKDFGRSIEMYLSNDDTFVRGRPYNADRKRIRAWIHK